MLHLCLLATDIIGGVLQVHGDDEVPPAIGVGLGENTGVHVDQQAGHDQAGRVQGLVEIGLHLDELILLGTASDVLVLLALQFNGGLEADLAATGLIVMANEDTGAGRQRVQALNRIVQVTSGASWEIATSSAEVLSEDGVSGEDGIAENVTEAVGSMAMSWEAPEHQSAGVNFLVLLEQAIELGSITLEVGKVEKAGEGLLHEDDLVADSIRYIVLGLEELGTGDVVGVGVGVDHHSQVEVVLVDELGYFLAVGYAHLPGQGVQIHDGIDDDGVLGLIVVDDKDAGEGVLVEEGLHGGVLARHGWLSVARLTTTKRVEDRGGRRRKSEFCLRKE